MQKKKWIGLCLLPVILSWLICGPVYANDSNTYGKEVLGFYCEDYPGDVRSYQSLQNNIQLLDYVASFDFQVQPNGELKEKSTQKDLQWTKGQGVKTLMLLHNINGGIDGASAYQAIAQEKSRDKLISNIITNMEQYGFDGVNIDFEGINPEGRTSFNIFLQQLADILQEKNKLLTVCVPAKTGSEQEPWYAAYDYAHIGKVADLVIIMSYDEHWAGSEPGPVASLPWVNRVMEYAVQQMPGDKILMGIPCYGYDWTGSGQGQGLTWRTIESLVQQYGNVQWDNTNSVPYLQYWQNGQKHEVWFENQYSLAMKLDLVEQHNLRGIAFWRLGYEGQAFWETVQNKL